MSDSADRHRLTRVLLAAIAIHGVSCGKAVVGNSSATSKAAPLPPATTSPDPPRIRTKPSRECPNGPEGNLGPGNVELERAIRSALNLGDLPINSADLEKITSLDLSRAKTDDALDLCVFAHLVGLKELRLAPGTLDDIGPLKHSKELESLSLAGTQFSTLQQLAPFTKLARLDLSKTPTADLTPLGDLTSLTELRLNDTLISDLAPLSKLKKLSVLEIRHTRVEDLSPLHDITTLKVLDTEGSAVRTPKP